MRAVRLPASRGLGWIGESFLIFRASPFRQLLFSLAFLMGLVIVLGLPKVGFLVAWLVIPALVVGPHSVARAAARGTSPGIAVLAEGFGRNRGPLLVLGAVFALGMLGVFGATALFDDGRLFQALAGGAPLRTEELREDGPLMDAIVLAAVLQTALLTLLWYAPLLVGWNGMPVGKALFFSAAATLINWRAFLVFGLGFTGLFTLVLIVALATSVWLAGPGVLRGGSPLFTAMWTLLPLWFGASYASYRDVFEAGQESPGEAEDEAAAP